MRFAGMAVLGLLMASATVYSFRKTLDEMDGGRGLDREPVSFSEGMEQAIDGSEHLIVRIVSMRTARVTDAGGLRLRVGVSRENGNLYWREPIDLATIGTAAKEPRMMLFGNPEDRVLFAIGPVSRYRAVSSKSRVFAIDGEYYVRVHEQPIAELTKTVSAKDGWLTSSFKTAELGLEGHLRYRVGT